MNHKEIFLQYLRDADRAVTLEEVLEETELEDTNANYNRLRETAEKLRENNLISSDFDRSGETPKARYYPTAKLYNQDY